ncbi:hypothetical protein [Ferrimonas pelagia]
MKKAILTTLGALGLLLPSMAPAAVKVGFGVDQGLGVALQFNQRINGFIGNDGVAADYLFARGRAAEIEGMPLNWYVGGGAFVGWDKGYGVRVPLGLELSFAPRWDVYLQVAPDLDFDRNDKFGVDAGFAVRYAF